MNDGLLSRPGAEVVEADPRATVIVGDPVRDTRPWALTAAESIGDSRGWDEHVRVLPMGEWEVEGRRLFGADHNKWAFRCPACGHSQTAEDFIKLGIAPKGKVYQTCVRRFMPEVNDPWASRCQFTLDSLVRFPTVVLLYKDREIPVFDYARPMDWMAIVNHETKLKDLS